MAHMFPMMVEYLIMAKIELGRLVGEEPVIKKESPC